MRPGKRNLITDVAGLFVGQSTDAVMNTGVSVLTSDKPFIAAIHVMGGAPGARETDALAPDRLVQEVHALVLSGGSAYGLDAASGVADALRAQGRGVKFGNSVVPVVPAAVIFDLAAGGNKDWDRNPYYELGAQAFACQTREFSLGSVGAGTGGRAGIMKGGTGSASVVLDSGLTVGALVAVNSLGDVAKIGDGRFWAAPFEMNDEFGGLGTPGAADLSDALPANLRGNTALAIVATDANLNQAQATRMATAAHDGIARAILPSHTLFDGDLIFAAATGEKPMTDPYLDQLQLGHAAAVAVSRAIARAIFEARASDCDLLPTWHQTYG